MGEIKTSLQIALEKTEAVKSDKSSIEQFEAKQKGKKMANAFLAGGVDLAAEIKSETNQKSLKQGIFDVLFACIALPSGKDDEKRLETAGLGLQIIITDKQFLVLYQQLMKIVSQFVQETAQYEQSIRQQYAPKLRQKEEEVSRRLGREVRIDPMQDPEFVALFNRYMNDLKSGYEPVIEQAKAQISLMFEK